MGISRPKPMPKFDDFQKKQQQLFNSGGHVKKKNGRVLDLHGAQSDVCIVALQDRQPQMVLIILHNNCKNFNFN